MAVLVDEYDKPILDALETPDVARANRDYLRGLYGVIKDSDAHVRFTFLTGISKFSKVNLFSQLNNLTDITLDSAYSSICGYTEGDLDTVFAHPLAGRRRKADACAGRPLVPDRPVAATQIDLGAGRGIRDDPGLHGVIERPVPLRASGRIAVENESPYAGSLRGHGLSPPRFHADSRRVSHGSVGEHRQRVLSEHRCPRVGTLPAAADVVATIRHGDVLDGIRSGA